MHQSICTTLAEMSDLPFFVETARNSNVSYVKKSPGRGFHKFFTIQEGQCCQLHFSWSVRKEIDVMKCNPPKPLISNFRFTDITGLLCKQRRKLQIYWKTKLPIMPILPILYWYVLRTEEWRNAQCSKTHKVSRQDSELCKDLAHDFPNKGLFQVSFMKSTIRTMTLTMMILMATDKSWLHI